MRRTAHAIMATRCRRLASLVGAKGQQLPLARSLASPMVGETRERERAADLARGRRERKTAVDLAGGRRERERAIEADLPEEGGRREEGEG